MTEAGDTAQVISALAAVIRAAPRAVFETIAQGDSHAVPGDAERHLRALDEVVTRFDCNLNTQPDNHWFPREPVELVSWGADGHDPRTIAVANALLMIADLDGGGVDYMFHRWDGRPGAAFFTALPADLRDPLLTGFDLLRRHPLWAEFRQRRYPPR